MTAVECALITYAYVAKFKFMQKPLCVYMLHLPGPLELHFVPDDSSLTAHVATDIAFCRVCTVDYRG